MDLKNENQLVLENKNKYLNKRKKTKEKTNGTHFCEKKKKVKRKSKARIYEKRQKIEKKEM